MKLVLLFKGKLTTNCFVLYRMYIDLNVGEYFSKGLEANSGTNRPLNEQDRSIVENVD